MFYIRWETPSQKPRAWKLRNWKWLWYINLRAPHCLVARTPLLSCAQWLFMYACTREDWPFTFILHRLNRAEITGICHGRGHILNYVMARRGGIDQSETSSHLTHLIQHFQALAHLGKWILNKQKALVQKKHVLAQKGPKSTKLWILHLKIWVKIFDFLYENMHIFSTKAERNHSSVMHFTSELLISCPHHHGDDD